MRCACGTFALAVSSSSPYHFMRYSQGFIVMFNSAMSCALSAAVSVMIESSQDTDTSPSSGRLSPRCSRAQKSMACAICEMESPSAFSCFLMLRMSAELSALTSVAVFTPPESSMSK